MASTFTLKSDSYQGRYLQLDCTQEKDISRNVSVIKWTLKTVGGSGTYYTTGPTTAKINGKQVYYKARTSWSSEAFPAAPGSVSGTTEVSHDNTGYASIPVSLSTAIYTSSVTTKSGTWTLDSIPRQATITAAPNFNDEQNPTITYSNPAGNAVTSLKACIANTAGTIVYADYRDISKTGSSYTFNLTDAERKALRKAATKNTLNVQFFVTTVIGGVYYYSTLHKEMSIVNADPILSPTAIDTGGYSVPLTGDANNKVIKGFNYMNVAVNATAQKEATIVSQSITCGSQRINGGSGGFNNVESGTFVFTATDSRGNTKTIPLEKELIPYITLTCNLKAPNPTPDGKTTLTISGNYYKGSFGVAENDMSLAYRIQKVGGTDSGWLNVPINPSANYYTIDVPIEGLDYKATYIVQARAADKCITPYTNEQKIKSTPVFDWGENDFQFNVPAYDELNNKMSGAAFAKMHTLGELDVRDYLTSWTINGSVSVGGFECDTKNGWIRIPKGTAKYIRVYAHIAGFGSYNGYLEMFRDGETNNYRNISFIHQYTGNGYERQTVCETIFEVDDTVDNNIKLWLSNYNNSPFTLNSGFGTSASFIVAEKIM